MPIPIKGHTAAPFTLSDQSIRILVSHGKTIDADGNEVLTEGFYVYHP